MKVENVITEAAKRRLKKPRVKTQKLYVIDDGIVAPVQTTSKQDFINGYAESFAELNLSDDESDWKPLLKQGKVLARELLKTL